MLLLELFGKPGQWQEVQGGPRTKAYKFTLPEPDSRTFVVNVIHNDKTMSGDRIWEVSFRDENDTRGISKSFDKTNKGNELAIFSTVLDIVGNFIAQNPDDIVMFSAEEMNRQTLYHRMLTRYIKPPMAFEMDGQDFYVGHKDLINELDV